MPIAGGNRGLRFAVEGWAALAPGLSTQRGWLEWFDRPSPLQRDVSPDLSWMPASLRRRVSPLGRSALYVLALCQHGEPCPVVFASRYGDLRTTANLLDQLRSEGQISPMGFSLAVHNAAVGIYSIARSNRMTTTSLAARTDLAESAFFEAVGWLASGSRVLVVCCEDEIPAPYRPEAGHRGFRVAWACRLGPAWEGGFSIEVKDGDAAMPSKSALPAGLEALAFLVGCRGDAMLSESGRYAWRRHD